MHSTNLGWHKFEKVGKCHKNALIPIRLVLRIPKSPKSWFWVHVFNCLKARFGLCYSLCSAKKQPNWKWCKSWKFFTVSDNFFVCSIIFIIWAFRESKKIEDQFWLDSTMAAWNRSKMALLTLSFIFQFSKFFIFLTALMMKLRQQTRESSNHWYISTFRGFSRSMFFCH